MAQDNIREFYRPLRTEKVEGVDTTPISFEPNTQIPLANKQIDSKHAVARGIFHPNLTPVLEILEKLGITPPMETGGYTQVSPVHGRAMVETLTSKKLLWADQYKIFFGDRDRKGGNMIHPHLVRDNFNYRWHVNGLKDNIGLTRLFYVSRIFRENGLPTEAPSQTIKLSEIYSHRHERPIPVHDWKKEVLEDLQQRTKIYSSLGLRGKAAHTQHDLDQIRNYLKNTDFYLIDRDLQVAERLADISRVDTKEEFFNMMIPIQNWLNAALEFGHEGLIKGTSAPPLFDLSKTSDIRRYFVEWGPSVMAEYLARLHSLRIVHKYPHAQNWSAVFSLYDLDSPIGEILGDGNKTTERDFYKDFFSTKTAIGALFIGPNRHLKSLTPNFLTRTLGQQTLFQARNRFVELYLEKTADNPPFPTNWAKIERA